MTENKKLLTPIADNRKNPRFTQLELQTYECLTNADLPQWQRDFSQWTWYTKMPISVWNEHTKLSDKVALAVVHGGKVELEQESIVEIAKITKALTYLFNQGVLPCSDRKSAAGILKMGCDMLDWQDFYAWYQAQQNQSAEGA